MTKKKHTKKAKNAGYCQICGKWCGIRFCSDKCRELYKKKLIRNIITNVPLYLIESLLRKGSLEQIEELVQNYKVKG